MINTTYSTFDKTPEAFNGVGAGIAIDVLPIAMIDRLHA